MQADTGRTVNDIAVRDEGERLESLRAELANVAIAINVSVNSPRHDLCSQVHCVTIAGKRHWSSRECCCVDHYHSRVTIPCRGLSAI